MTWTPQQILTELIELDEHQRIEAKRASEIGSSVMQTVCAFANEPGLGGGYLLLGVAEPDLHHDTFWVCGVNNVDTLLTNLQNNCRNQFECVVKIDCKHAKIDDKSVIGVYVHELEPGAKPCRFQGKPDKHNKRKTGVWRRGANGDYECAEKELEEILLAKVGMRYEQLIFPDASFDDLDKNAIALYRKLRANVRPNAEELKANDVELLLAMKVIKKVGEEYLPNIAGLLLFGSTLALRRLLPATRVDYVRVAGTQWVEDPNKRFEYSYDVRESFFTLIPKLENIILDDMPRYFRLEEGKIQRSDQPFLPQKVIRESIVNALMHRDYSVNQPTIIVRYSNRIEMHNAGYSLKPLDEYDAMASALRNPILSYVLYDVDFAETKGTGFRTMRRLLDEAGLTKPIISSKRDNNNFKITFLLHQLMNENQLLWLRKLKTFNLSDNEARALIIALEIGAIDNAALRAVTDLDTLSVSKMLGRLWQQCHLLEKGGSGRSTYYKPSRLLYDALHKNPSDPDSNGSDLGTESGNLDAESGDLDAESGDLPAALQQEISELGYRSRNTKPVILKICLQSAYTAEAIATLLSKNIKSLKSAYLTPLCKGGLLVHSYPEVRNHPQQAYITTEKGSQYLKDQEKQ